MTSEVLMLNKDAVVMAADSAVTTGRDPHPRYSKAANKIFDLCVHGNVAVAIYSAAEIDNVPWELALKLFRSVDRATPQRPRLLDYVDALVTFLQGNTTLFPSGFQGDLLQRRVAQAASHILSKVSRRFPDFEDGSKTVGDRQTAWAKGYSVISADLGPMPYHARLEQADYLAIKGQSAQLEAYLGPLLASESAWKHADVGQLTELAIEALVKLPTDFLSYTGVVIAGYGADEIFPSFSHIYIYGHVGSKLVWEDYYKYAITHDNDAWIQPFAQSAMIDRFTDGFDSTLFGIINSSSKTSFDSIIYDLRAAGVAIPDAIANPILTRQHNDFMDSWKQQNWSKNFHPLRRVLNSLSVSEMGHLAESLLVLEELRERVTSPSESVGGPIDVAVVTKSEGLIWLKRKHYFPPELNSKYFGRMKSIYNQ